jgi:CRISPR-associated protein (TIGR03986 family)
MSRWPKHGKPRKDRSAKAPYNFVPLPERVVTVDPERLPDQDRYYPDRHTGWIDCELTTASPLYVRAALEPHEFERSLDKDAEAALPWRGQIRNKPDFFYTQDRLRPVIPGSSLRGMLRALVEIVAYGKVQWVSQRKLFYRAVADRMTTLRESYHQQMETVKAGYVEEKGGDYWVRPAKAVEGKTFFKVTERVLEKGNVPFVSIFEPNYRPQYVSCWFQPSDRFPDSVGVVSHKPKPGYIKGVLVCSGPFGKKKRKHWIVPEKDDSSEPLSIPEDTVREYIDTLTPHQKQKPFSAKTGCLVGDRPIFYLSQGGKVIDFGPTRYFRVAYRESGKGTASSARAEAVFGYVESEERSACKDVARAGRVFVSDAVLDEKQPLGDIWLVGNRDRVITPKILSGPKPTAFPHYLTQRKPDRIRVRGKQGDRYILDLAHYASATPEETVIRGHKLYWHKGNINKGQINETEKVRSDDTQHTQMKPVRSGVRFRFHIWFENLDQIELGALLWVLTLPGPGKYCHKLGMGKPLGLGAVVIRSALHLTNRRVRYHGLFNRDNWNLGLDVDDNSNTVDVKAKQRQALKAFERLILGDEMLNPGSQAQSLAKVPRIRDLLSLLCWPGPAPAKTEYIGVLKEFTKRTVLPPPSSLIGSDTVLSSEARPAQESMSKVPRAASEPTLHEALPREATSGPLVPGSHTGTVTYFNLKDGLGTILPDGSGAEIEIRMDQLRDGVRYLVKGQRVSFTVVKSDTGVGLEDVGPD